MSSLEDCTHKLIVQKSNTIKICQFNVENLFLFMERYDEKTPIDSISEVSWQMLSLSPRANKSLLKTLELAKIIKDINADIYFFNEVGGPDSLYNFNKYFLNEEYDVKIIKGNSDRGIDNGYLVSKKFFPDSITLKTYRDRTFFLTESKTHKIKFSRDVLRLDFNFSKFQFTLLGVHLKSKLNKPGDFQGIDRRKSELNECVKIIKEVEKEKRTPVLLGDFNGLALEDEHEPEFNLLFKKTNLRDFHDYLNTKLEDRVSHIHFIGKSRKFIKSQFDYIMIPQKLANCIDINQSYRYCFKGMFNEILDFPKSFFEKSKLPSDHYPQVLTLNLL